MKFPILACVFVIQPIHDHVRSLQFSLKPSSRTYSLQIYCIGLVGFESTSTMKEVREPSSYKSKMPKSQIILPFLFYKLLM